MKIFSLVLFLFSNAFAEEARLLKITGPDVIITRGKEKLKAVEGFAFEEGDTVQTVNATILIHLFPSTQVAVDKNTTIKIDKNVIESTKKLEKSFSIVGLEQGRVRLKILKDNDQEIDQKLVTDRVAFSARAADFEVSATLAEVALDVHEGLVEASSPFVHSFVPEMTKANEALVFSTKTKSFSRRKFASQVTAPHFVGKADLMKNWKASKKARAKKSVKKKK